MSVNAAGIIASCTNATCTVDGYHFPYDTRLILETPDTEEGHWVREVAIDATSDRS